MKKIYIFSRIEVDEEGTEKTYKEMTSGNLDEVSLASLLDIHNEKVGKMERKVSKDLSADLSNENA